MSQERKDSAVVIALSVIGLVFGLMGMLGSFIPIIGSIALYVGIPAAGVSLIATLLARKKHLSQGLPVASLTLSLIGVVVSTAQYIWIGGLTHERTPQETIAESRQPVPTKQPVPTINWAERFAQATPATFAREPFEHYGYTFHLFPAGVGEANFPLLGQAKASQYFDFVAGSPVAANLSPTTIAKYCWVEGFATTCKRAAALDVYEFHARRLEIADSLLACRRAYVDEYATYLKTVFIISMDEVVIREQSYDLNTQQVRIHTPFAAKAMPNVSLSNYSDPQERMLENLGMQGYINPVTVVLPVETARAFFASYPGKVGNRVGKGLVTYWVMPTMSYVEGVRLRITAVKLLRAELTLQGASPMKIVLFENLTS